MDTYTIITEHKANVKCRYKKCETDKVFKENKITIHNITKEYLLCYIIDYCGVILDNNDCVKEPSLEDVKIFRYYNNDADKINDILKFFVGRYNFYKTLISKLEHHNWLNDDVKSITETIPSQFNEFEFDIGKYEDNIVDSITICKD